VSYVRRTPRYLGPTAAAAVLAAAGFLAAGREATNAAPDLSLTVTTVSPPATTTVTPPAVSATTSQPATTSEAPSRRRHTPTRPVRTAAAPVEPPSFPGWVIAGFALSGVLIVSGLAGFVYTRSR
jgi:hypothetical protein